jgi:phosphoglycolate phosphatase-like HAD superfamily hydrolase
MSSKTTFKKVIYFDFTGTLLDPFINIRDILNSVSKEKGFTYYDKTDLETIIKMPSLALLNKFSIPDTHKTKIVQEVLLRLEDEIQYVPPIAGIKNMLYTLRDQNCYLGILPSNREGNIKKWLLTNELDIFLDVSSIIFQQSKAPYLQQIKNSFPTIDFFAFVADEVKDLIQAREAGFSPVGVT